MEVRYWDKINTQPLPTTWRHPKPRSACIVASAEDSARYNASGGATEISKFRILSRNELVDLGGLAGRDGDANGRFREINSSGNLWIIRQFFRGGASELG